MLWKDQVTLISDISITINETGDPIPNDDGSLIFANKKSVRQSEFYQAMAVGLKLELMFEVRKTDYSGQEWLESEGVKYQIIRTYSKNDEIIELVCKSEVV